MGDFEQKFNDYKQQIDAALEVHSKRMLIETKSEFGDYPAEAVQAYCEVLKRGGKRIRGVLTMASYKMHGGQDEEVALQAACAIEMLQAYILITDDIQDESLIRRGGPSAHILLKDLHEQQGLAGNSLHFGESIAMNAMLFGAHSALNVLADLNVNAKDNIRAIKNVNKHFISTAHGQTLDIFNEATQTTDEEAVNKVLIWKTAFYTILNPLQLGAIVAGASDEDIERFKPYALAAGRAFQITDDIIGIFGDDEKTGKSAMDDIKEGKRTILSVKALQLANEQDAKFLESMLGNKDITETEFERCKAIIEQSGALKHAQKEAKESARQAKNELQKTTGFFQADSKQVKFLQDITQMILGRTA